MLSITDVSFIKTHTLKKWIFTKIAIPALTLGISVASLVTEKTNMIGDTGIYKARVVSSQEASSFL